MPARAPSNEPAVAHGAHSVEQVAPRLDKPAQDTNPHDGRRHAGPAHHHAECEHAHDAGAHAGHSHAGYPHVGHSHAGHSHAGHSHADHGHAGHSHAGHTHADHSHAGHSHADHTHAGHPHAGHPHAGHPHAGHSHAGHSHADHGHAGHTHHHGFQPGQRVTRAFAMGVALNLAFVIVELSVGVAIGSTALLADAAHNVGDVIGLLLGWGAAVLATKAPSTTHTYGLRRATLLAAFLNAVVLVAAVGTVAREAVERLLAPAPLPGATVALVAAAGVIVNGGAALLFARGRHHDLNQRGAYLHLMADAAVSVAVLLSGLLVWITGATWLDPAMSLLVTIVVLWSGVALLRASTALLLDRVPHHIDVRAVKAYLAALPRVQSVCDLHVWSLSTTEVALTAHLVIEWTAEPPVFLDSLHQALRERFGIAHATVALHTKSDRCALAPH